MEDVYRTIIVGVDFSAGSRSALKVAGDLARRSGAVLRVLHYVHLEIAEEHRETWKSGLNEVVQLASKELERFVSAALPDGDEINMMVEARVGHRFVELINLIHETDADLLVLGAHGDDHRYRQAPGLLGMKCIRKAPCEVMLVPNDVATPFEQILVGIDYSANSATALMKAVEMGSITGAKVHVVHISLPPWLFLMDAGLPNVEVPERARRAYLRHQESEMERFIESLSCRCDFDFSTLERKDLATGLIECQKEMAADLVVIGNRGRTGAELALLGSFAERVVRDADCSVLTVKQDSGTKRAAQGRKYVA